MINIVFKPEDIQKALFKHAEGMTYGYVATAMFAQMDLQEISIELKEKENIR